MPLTQEEIDRRLEEFHAKFLPVLSSKNVDEILKYYHKDAVIVHPNNKVIFGEDILKMYEECCKQCPQDKEGPPYKVVPIKNMATADGEFLIQEAILECQLPGKDEPVNIMALGIFKKAEDGSYQYYRDEADISAMKDMCPMMNQGKDEKNEENNLDF